MVFGVKRKQGKLMKIVYVLDYGLGVKPIDLNFHLQKSFEVFQKKFSWQNLIQQG